MSDLRQYLIDGLRSELDNEREFPGMQVISGPGGMILLPKPMTRQQWEAERDRIGIGPSKLKPLEDDRKLTLWEQLEAGKL